MTERMPEEKYREFYESYLRREEKAHEKNQKKIENGLKINIFLPLIFLGISFMTDSSKLVWLILWIVSLFGIAFYLVYVEYSDYKMREQLKEFGIEREDALIGAQLEVVENIVNDTIDAVDNKTEEIKQAIEDKKNVITEKKNELVEKTTTQIAETKEKVTDLISKKKEDDDNA
ncbi:MAG: hypothetical protein IIZ61_00795 [Lachnospiraceae bacterium]|nr:hypothetical protein [Lachnospiraceae bacterium]